MGCVRRLTSIDWRMNEANRKRSKNVPSVNRAGTGRGTGDACTFCCSVAKTVQRRWVRYVKATFTKVQPNGPVHQMVDGSIVGNGGFGQGLNDGDV